MKVRNVGNVDTVTITALSTRAMVTAVTPLPMSIPAGGQQIVEFDMLVPDTQVLPPTADLSATVSSIFDVTSNNSTSADLTVLEPRCSRDLSSNNRGANGQFVGKFRHPNSSATSASHCGVHSPDPCSNPIGEPVADGGAEDRILHRESTNRPHGTERDR